MIKLFCYTFVIFNLFIAVNQNVFAQISFEKTYGGPLCETGKSVEQTMDGGYIIVGTTESFGAGEGDIYLIKTNLIGETLWTRSFGGTSYDYGGSARQTSDGGYIIAGSKSDVFPFLDLFLIKTNSDGDTLWTKSYNYGRSLCNDIQQTSDGGYVIAGGLFSGPDYYIPFLLKTNLYGDTLWIKLFYSDWRMGSMLHSVQQTTDGGYILADWYSTIKTDSTGQTIWRRCYGDTSFGYPSIGSSSVQQTTDGGYIITGYNYDLANNRTCISLIKVCVSGDTIWTRKYNYWNEYDCYGYSVKQTFDGGYIITGGYYDQNHDAAILIKTGSTGDTLWTKTFGEGKHDPGHSVNQTNDGGYVFVGTTYEYSDSSDIYLIKTLPDGTVVPVELKSFTAFNSYQLEQNYPNPFNPTTTIGFGIQNKSNVMITVFNAIGEEVAVVLNEEKESGFHQVKFDASTLPSGVYFYQLKAGDFIQVKKMVLMK